MEQREDPHRSVGRDEVEVGHPASQQGVSVAEVVGDVEAGEETGEALARPVEAQHLLHRVAQCLDPGVGPLDNGLRHRVPQRSSSGRVPLCVVGVQQAVW